MQTTNTAPGQRNDFAEGDRVRWVLRSSEDIYGTVTAGPHGLFIRGNNGTPYAIRDNWELASRAPHCPVNDNDQDTPLFGFAISEKIDQDAGALYSVTADMPADEQPVETVGANPLVMITNDLGEIEHVRRDVFERHYRAFGWRITSATPAEQKPRRNARVTDNARAIADFIDAHPDLGEIYTLDSTAREVKIQVSGKNLAAELLAWFYRLDDATISRNVYEASTHIQVKGKTAGVRVCVYTGFRDEAAVAALVNEPTVHTLRALQIAGAR